MSQRLQVLILAAGKGVRFRSDLPKVLHPICGMTMLEHVLRAAAGLAPTEIVIVVGHGEDAVRAEIERATRTDQLKNCSITFVRQEQQLGTGHAVQCALQKLDPKADILILSGDSPFIRTSTLKNLVESFTTKKCDLALLTARPPSTSGYGRIVRDRNGNLTAIVEEKDASEEQKSIPETNAAMYLVQAAFLQDSLAKLERKNAQKEFYLTDIVEYGVKAKKKVIGELVANPMEVAGANSRPELALLEAHRRTEILHALMEQGVRFEDPESTYIDEDVQIGRDSVIGAGTRIRRGCKIHAGVTIDGDTLITESEIGARTHIKLGCMIESSAIGADCRVGPFAHLRPGTVLHDKVHIGNFVETKQSELMYGAKANHLSYVGDSTVGAEANIGAGTITCNYDGYEKHRTVIGKQAFIGSNTALVAPVSVGDEAVVGAGSTITKNVPAGALAVERNEQVNVDGWAARQATKKQKKKK